MATTEWSNSFEASPVGSAARSQGDDRIRELKQAIRERAENGGHYMQDNVNPYSKDGRHVQNMGGGPHWYKSDAVTKEMEFVDDTHIVVHDNFQVQGTLLGGTTNDLSAGPITSTSIAAHAATQTQFITSNTATTVTHGGANFNNDFGPFTLGSPKGILVVSYWAYIEALAAVNTASITPAIDYTNGGTFNVVSVYNPANLYAPARSGALATNICWPGGYYDPMSASTNGGQYKLRFVFAPDPTNDYIVRGFVATVLELRR